MKKPFIFEDNPSPSRTLVTIKGMILRFQRHDLMGLSAQLTYYILLALFPFLYLLSSFSRYTYLSEETFVQSLADFLPKESYLIIYNIVQEITSTQSAGGYTAGFLVMIWLASRGTRAIMKGTNRAYDEVPKRRITRHIPTSLFFTFMILILFVVDAFFLLFASNALSWIVTVLFRINITDVALNRLVTLISLGITFLNILLIYRFAPGHHPKLIEVLPGTVFSTFGWMISSNFFGLYVSRFAHYLSFYGSLWGLFALLIWLYISSLVLLLGAELNAELASNQAQFSTNKKKEGI